MGCIYAVTTSQGLNDFTSVLRDSTGPFTSVPNLNLACSDGTTQYVGNGLRITLEGKSFSYDSGVGPGGDYSRESGYYTANGKQVFGQESIRQSQAGVGSNVVVCTAQFSFSGHVATKKQAQKSGLLGT